MNIHDLKFALFIVFGSFVYFAIVWIVLKSIGYDV